MCGEISSRNDLLSRLTYATRKHQQTLVPLGAVAALRSSATTHHASATTPACPTLLVAPALNIAQDRVARRVTRGPPPRPPAPRRSSITRRGAGDQQVSRSRACRPAAHQRLAPRPIRRDRPAYRCVRGGPVRPSTGPYAEELAGRGAYLVLGEHSANLFMDADRQRLCGGEDSASAANSFVPARTARGERRACGHVWTARRQVAPRLGARAAQVPAGAAAPQRATRAWRAVRVRLSACRADRWARLAVLSRCRWRWQRRCRRIGQGDAEPQSGAGRARSAGVSFCTGLLRAARGRGIVYSSPRPCGKQPCPRSPPGSARAAPALSIMRRRRGRLPVERNRASASDR